MPYIRNNIKQFSFFNICHFPKKYGASDDSWEYNFGQLQQTNSSVNGIWYTSYKSFLSLYKHLYIKKYNV